MKKALIIILLIASGAGGYLYYDWHAKTRALAREPSITLYSWTDRQGGRHFTDTAPPPGAENIQTSRGYKYVGRPLVATLRDQAAALYRRIRDKLFSPGRRKTKKSAP